MTDFFSLPSEIRQIARLGGVVIVPTANAVKMVEDWSMVRSPSRARRRLKYGHRQNIRTAYEPVAYRMDDRIYMHPVLYNQLKNMEALRHD